MELFALFKNKVRLALRSLTFKERKAKGTPFPQAYINLVSLWLPRKASSYL